MPLDTTWMDALPPAAPTAAMQSTGAVPPPSTPASPSGQEGVLGAGGVLIPYSPPPGAPAVNLPSAGTAAAQPIAIDVGHGHPQVPDTSWMDAIPAAAPTPAMQAAAGPNHGATPAEPAPQSAATRFVQGLASTVEGIPRGVLGGPVIDYGNAALATPLNMIYGQPPGTAPAPMSAQSAPDQFRAMNPASAFDQSLAEQQAGHAGQASQAPVANVAGQVAGALGTGITATPALAYKAPAAATELLPKVTGMLSSVGSYLARNAAFGALTNYMAGGNPTTGAELGGGLAAAIPVVGKVLSAPLAAVKPLTTLLSKGAQTNSIGQNLLRSVSPSDIETSSVGPLDLAQATNNPDMAVKTDLAPGYNAAANARMRGAQQDAVGAQIEKIGAPASEADASSSFVNAVRGARGAAGREETRLWTVPKLADAPVTADPIRAAVNGAIGDMDPVMRDAMSPQLRSQVNRLNGADPTTVRDLNGIRSRLGSVARNSLDGTERSQARTLSDAFMSGMDQVPEIAGAPARTFVPPPPHPNYAGPPRDPITIPEITPDPEITDAYKAARDYTRQMRSMFADPQLAALMKKTEGVYRKDPSEGARLFFNFSNGSSEGPQSIAQLSEFVENLKAQPGSMKIAADLRDSAKSYVAAALSRASRLGEGQNFNPKLMMDFLSKNMDWMEKSGLFEKPQIEAAQQLMEYAQMLRRPEQLLRQVNSATQPRQARAATFVDQIMSPWTRRLGELLVTAGAAHEHGGLGGALGLMASQGFEHAVAKAETAMREAMAGAVLDSSVAKGLMMKASAGNRGFLPPAARELLSRLPLAVGSDVVPHFAGQKALPTPVSVGQ